MTKQDAAQMQLDFARENYDAVIAAAATKLRSAADELEARYSSEYIEGTNAAALEVASWAINYLTGVLPNLRLDLLATQAAALDRATQAADAAHE